MIMKENILYNIQQLKLKGILLTSTQLTFLLPPNTYLFYSLDFLDIFSLFVFCFSEKTCGVLDLKKERKINI